MPYSVEGSCEIDIHSSGLLRRKVILDVLYQQGDLIYGRPPVSKTRPLLMEQWVDGWFDTRADESREDPGDIQTRYRAIVLWISQ